MFSTRRTIRVREEALVEWQRSRDADHPEVPLSQSDDEEGFMNRLRHFFSPRFERRSVESSVEERRGLLGNQTHYGSTEKCVPLLNQASEDHEDSIEQARFFDSV